MPSFFSRPRDGAAAARDDALAAMDLPSTAQMDEIVGEISGEAALRHILAMSAYRGRKPANSPEHSGKAQYVLDRSGSTA
jgi:hypothetical protein